MRTILRRLWLFITKPFRLIDSLVRLIHRLRVKLFKGLRAFFAADPEEAPMGDVIQTAAEDPTTLLEHITALRGHLLRAVVGLLVSCTAALIFIRPLLDWITAPIPGGLNALVAIDVTEPIMVVMRVILLAGFAVSLPYITLEILLFIAPGLSLRARLLGLLAIPLVFILFAAGALFAYYVMIPPAIDLLIGFMGIKTDPRPSSYLSLMTSLMFWIGLAFEFPLIVYILSAMGIVRAEWLVNYWRHALVLLTIIAAMITPTIDIVNMVLVLGPLVVLYFFSVLLAFIGQRRRKQTS